MTIEHPAWRLEVPTEWVDGTPQARAFLERRAQAPGDGTPELRGLVTLLNAQGCLSADGGHAEYSLREIRDLFLALAHAWYGRYYAHPLWERLRGGTLSRTGLAAWLVHNYHVSRSAGMSDARCATRLTRLGLRRDFARNAVDEYSHCDEFYFVRHPRLSLDDEEVKHYVHLPGSLAFDQQMLRMAEEDWLGHLLVSFFQESTARYYDDSKKFYAKVEEQYGLPGFFRPWEKHIELDLRFGHASRLEKVLESDELCDRATVATAMTNAWLTFHFLYTALDEILAERAPSDEVALRRPVRHSLLDPRASTLAAHVPHATALRAGDAATLIEELLAAGAMHLIATLDDDQNVRLQCERARAAYKALSYCRDHDDIILFGRLADAEMRELPAGLNPLLPLDPAGAAPETVALQNLISEAAVSPLDIAFLFGCAAAQSFVPLTVIARGSLDQWLRRRRISIAERDRLATLALQFNELLTKWAQRQPFAPFDPFSD